MRATNVLGRERVAFERREQCCFVADIIIRAIDMKDREGTFVERAADVLGASPAASDNVPVFGRERAFVFFRPEIAIPMKASANLIRHLHRPAQVKLENSRVTADTEPRRCLQRSCGGGGVVEALFGLMRN